jgi:hypothetical protein
MKQILFGRISLSILFCFFLTSSWGQITTFDYSGGMVSYTVPPGATEINITSLGAQGAAGDVDFIGGLGASMSGDFTVTPGDMIILAVGQMGLGQSSGTNGGGGGGSFAVLADPGAPDVIVSGPFSGTAVTPMVIAGGGAGTRDFVSQNGNPGVTGLNGTTGSLSAETGGGLPSGVAPGLGGLAPSASWGSGGGGFRGNGVGDSGYGNGGNSFLNGAAGGTGGSGSGDNAAGGFGGGGQGRGSWGGGGGGGYTGGDGGRVGGGGGSFNSGANQVNSAGVRSGNGQIIITVLCDGLVPDISAVEVCDGEEVTLSAVSTNGGVITWDGGVIDGIAFTPPVGLNTYNATSDNTDDCGYTIDILVLASPTVTLAVTAIELCEDESVVFTHGGDADTYTYDPVDVVDGVAYTPAALGTATYTVTGVDDITGCENQSSVDVLLNAVPVITATVSETEICEFETVIFTSGGDADTYEWDPADIIEGTPYTPADGSLTATVTGTFDATGCDTDESILVTVNPTPYVNATSGDENYCVGESVVLGAGGDADLIVWDPTDLEPGIGTHTYTVTGTYDGGDCEATDEVTITVHANPTVTASVDYSEICVGQGVILTGSGADTYEWDPAMIIDGESYDPGMVGTYTYNVIGTDVNGCTDEASVSVTVVDEIEITYVVIDEMIFEDGEINITVTGGVSPYTFDWDNDGTGDFDDTEDLTGLASALYTVVVNGSTGCSGTVDINLGTQVGIDDLNQATFAIYPNPTTNNITVEFEGTFYYELTDMNGAVISRSTATDKELISLESLARGVYFVTIKSNDTIQTVKVVKK